MILLQKVTPFIRGTSSESDKGHNFFPFKVILKPKRKKIEQRRPLHGKASSPSAPPLAYPKNHHKKLDKKRKKIDKNGTFILQQCPVR